MTLEESTKDFLVGENIKANTERNIRAELGNQHRRGKNKFQHNPLKPTKKRVRFRNRGGRHNAQVTNTEKNMSIPNTNKKAMTQFNADAKLLGEFEHSEGDSGQSFNYSKSVKSSPGPIPGEQIAAYLSKIQRGGLIQSFGCLLAIEEPSFRILAYSENSIDLLGLNNISVEFTQFECLLGFDARQLFTNSSSSSLMKAAASQDISLSNPVWVVSENTQRPFLAILHRVDVGIVINLEPVMQGDPSFSVDGAVQSQKLALQAISRMQALPRGDIDKLCETLLKHVKDLTGYDRVMVYKFHEDEHGEVVSEIKRSDLEPYIGLHYPATDVPQAARFLFNKIRVRMICDTRATPVGIIQSKELKQPLILVNSTLRAPHGCHTQYMINMGSMASLVMTIIVNENNSMKLWGLVSCHHVSPRYLAYPIRYACEFIMQAFGSRLSMELQLVLHIAEKKIIMTHALLCDMILKDVPFGIVAKSPNVMDLVNCKGVAFYYGGVYRVLGVTPTEVQIKDITEWLLDYDKDLTVWSTDSLTDVGYPNASMLSEVVCGMAAARITSNDFLFWFRSQTEKEVRWGGAKHHHVDKDEDKGMHPRSSFKAFLEVVKNRSFPWEAWEMNAIHLLRHTMQNSFQNIENDSLKMAINTQQNDLEMDKLTLVANEMVRLFETAATPIFATDSTGNINKWNSKIAELTGLPASEAIGKSLVDELVHEESRVSFGHHLSRALQGDEDKNIELRFRTLGQKQQNKSVFIVANACSCIDYTDNVSSVGFVGQDITEAKIVLSKFARLQEDYKAITQSLPPIFISDKNARCSEWNASMEKLTGWKRSEVIGKMLPGKIFGELCRMKGQDDVTKLMILLYQTLCSHDNETLPFSFFGKEGIYVEAILTTNKKIDMSRHIVGCFCFLQTILPNTQQALHRMDCFSGRKGLEYIRQEIKNPLSGIQFTHKLLESTHVSDHQKQLLETSDACERQMTAIIEATNIENIEDDCLELNMDGFLLKKVLDAIVSQVMILLVEKNLHLIQEISEEITTLYLYGDQVRLQQVLSNFLLHIVHHTPTSNGCVEVRVNPSSKLGREHVQLQFRMIHHGEGLPLELIQDMFRDENQWTSQEGFGLNLSRKLLRKMNGDIQYIRESSECYFLVDIKFQTTEGRAKKSEVDVNKHT